MRAPKWQTIHEPSKRQFRLNGYRVLLTRGRAGNIIYVPGGDVDDPTRVPSDYDATFGALLESGCVKLVK